MSDFAKFIFKWMVITSVMSFVAGLTFGILLF